MDAPDHTSYYRLYRRDGRMRLVQTCDEKAQLAPEWGESPWGPWADPPVRCDGLVIGVECWGPFAYSPLWAERDPSPQFVQRLFREVGRRSPLIVRTLSHGVFRQMHQRGAVWATRPLVYPLNDPEPSTRWVRAVGEVFRLEGTIYDEDLLTTRLVRPITPQIRLSFGHLHRPSWRIFVDYESLADYARCYNVGDLASVLAARHVFTYLLTETAATPWDAHPAVAPEPEALEQERQEQDLEKSSKFYEPRYYKDKELFKEHVQDVFFDYCDLEGEPPGKEYVAKHLKTPLSVKTMDRYLDYWHIPYPPYR